MDSQNNISAVKPLGDPSLIAGDKVILNVIWSEVGLIFESANSETNRVGDRLPLCFIAMFEEEPGLMLGGAYLADVTEIVHLLDVVDINGTKYGVVAVAVENLKRHEEWTDIELKGDCLVRKLMCGNNLMDEEVIPVTVSDQTYRYDYVPDRLINITEVRIGDAIVFQMPALEPAIRGTMSDSLIGLLPNMSLQEYEKIGTYGYDWETMRRFATSQPIRLSQVAC